MKYLMTICPVFPGWEPQSDSFVKQQIEIETKYEGYIKRQFDAVKKLKDQEKRKSRRILITTPSPASPMN
ncbi:MAG: hypothetical protein MZV65_00405 [Chromatiales bacterium]|nr:hypothetical protein [Chromatiales bacterium]